MSIRWPSREEWAAKAEHSVRTACYPLERVPEAAEHYLSPGEVAEMRRLHVEVSKAARPVLTGEIDRIRETLPQPIPARSGDYYAWFDSLTPEQMAAASRLSTLKHIRRDIGRVASGRSDPLAARWTALGYTVLTKPAAALLSGLAGWERLGELDAKWEAERQRAADDALAAAIAREVAKRDSDEGWAKELERRARIDGHLPSTLPGTDNERTAND